MKRIFPAFLSSLPLGARLLIILFALGFPLALAGHYTRTFDLLSLVAFSSDAVWQGQLWRLLTYAFLPMGILDWLISLFWLTTLVCVLGRNWRGKDLWSYCLLSALATSALLTLLRQPKFMYAGNGAIILALVAAWSRLYGRERIILLGIGEMSVGQAAAIVAIVELLILLFSFGWLVTLASICGGLAGWLYLFLRGKTALNRRSQLLDSARIARLEI
jgi:membrane associated rhomboid family serine protease